MSEHTQAKRVGWVLRGTSYPAGATTMIFVVLAERSNAEGRCWPSMATLAAEARCSPRAAQYALRQLERDGWIVIGKQRGPNGANLYRIHLARLEKAFTAAEVARKARIAAELETDTLAFAEVESQAIPVDACGNSPKSVEIPATYVENFVVRVGNTPPSSGNFVEVCAGGVQRLPGKGATHCTPGVQPIAPKPPVFQEKNRTRSKTNTYGDEGEPKFSGLVLPPSPTRTLHPRPP